MSNHLDRLNQLQSEIGALERQLDYLTSEEVLTNVSSDVAAEFESIALDITDQLNGKVLELRDFVNNAILNNLAEVGRFLSLIDPDSIESQIDALIDEAGGEDASVPEILGNLAQYLDIAELNQVIDIYNRVNDARQAIARTKSSAADIDLSIPGISQIGSIIGDALKSLLSDIKSGLSIEALEFKQIREDWKGPVKIAKNLGERYF
ncbi:MAG: hypothetical protein VW683_00320 [Betaproteobacteria bacterium]|jgi:hypothetical protein